MTAILSVRDLAVRFGEKPVLSGVTFTLAEGGTLAVIGPNGSGKTVLAKALIGAIPYAGTVTWAPGVKIGYIPQKLDIERDLPLTGRDFLTAKARVTGSPGAEVTHALELVRLSEEIVVQPIGTLSGGQFQRLLLAFALIGRPNVLLFDEPTAGVDQPGQEDLYDMIHRVKLTEHTSLILITHELSLVYHRADQVLCLSYRAQPCVGPPVEVLTPQRLGEMYGTPLKFHVHRDHDG
jgi:zinc transport system ATP-binding protein